MLLAIEPEYVPAQSEAIHGVRLLGIEATRRTGSWPTLRHVFDLDQDAGLYVEVDPLADVQAFAIGFDAYANEIFSPL